MFILANKCPKCGRENGVVEFDGEHVDGSGKRAEDRHNYWLARDLTKENDLLLLGMLGPELDEDQRVEIIYGYPHAGCRGDEHEAADLAREVKAKKAAAPKRARKS